jgi:Rps23 Pro-64 3,4-dihydroxylase Tpa1-like proline 4-hydroxylase
VSDTREKLADLILERLNRDRDDLRSDFARLDRGVTARYTVVDDLLPVEWASRIAAGFPASGEMRLLDSFRERKYTSKSLDRYNPLIADITFAFQDKRVINTVAEITDIRDAVGDPHLYAGGLSAMERGHFLNPHIDNSHDGDGQNYRVLNLLSNCGMSG